MSRLSIKKNNLVLCFILIMETISIKFLQYKVLPQKYFYDSKKILSIMNGSTLTDKGYSFTANFFKSINFLKFNSIQQWSIAISIVFLLFFILYFSKKEIITTNFFYIIASYALLNIYVFNLSKDVIQLFFFLIAYFICKKFKCNDFKKIILVAAIFFIESLFFRTYYLIIGALVIGLYFVYSRFFIDSKNIKKSKKKTSAIIIISFAIFMIMIYVLQKVSVENYMLLINARISSNIYRDGVDAITMINDLFSNSSYFNFILNYIINAIRILFPVELFLKSIKYIPFIIFQFYFSNILLKNMIKINKEKSIFLFIVMAFVMVSIIYEPDFGSVIRHESVLMLFILELVGTERKKKNEKSICNYSNI